MDKKSPVILKISKNGIQVELDSSATFREIIEDIEKKFRDGKDFFKDATVALYLKGRFLTDEEEDEIIHVISKNSNLNIVCLIKESKDMDGLYVEAIKTSEKILDDDKKSAVLEEKAPQDNPPENSVSLVSGNDGGTDELTPEEFDVHFGDITDNQVLDSSHSILLFGNVDKTSAVLAGKNLLILGKVSGIAEAGRSDKEKCYIGALAFDPVKLSIGDTSFKPSLFGDHKYKSSNGKLKYALVSDQKVKFTENTAELRSNLS